MISRNTDDSNEKIPLIVSKYTVGLSDSFTVTNLTKNWGLPQIKLFFCFLEYIDWSSDEDQDCTVIIDKRVIKENLNMNFAEDGHNSFDTYLRRELQKLVFNSGIEFAWEKDKRYRGINMFRYYDMWPKTISLTYEYIFKELLYVIANKKHYYLIRPEDIYGFTTKHTLPVYMKLRTAKPPAYEKSYVAREFEFNAGLLKEIIGLPEKKYMRKSPQGNGECFDFYNFERYVLQPIIKDLMKCKGITLLPNRKLPAPSGNPKDYYKVTKDKNSSHKREYTIKYTVNDWVKVGKDGQPFFIPRGLPKKFVHDWEEFDKVEVYKLRNDHHVLGAQQLKGVAMQPDEVAEHFLSFVEGIDIISVAELKKKYSSAAVAGLKAMKDQDYYQLC